MKKVNLFPLLTFLLFTVFVSCGSSPKEKEDAQPGLVPPQPEPIGEPAPIDLSTEIDGNWKIVGYLDGSSKQATKLDRSIPLTLQEGNATLSFIGRTFKGTYKLNTTPRNTLAFSPLTPSSTKGAEDARKKYLESFVSESVGKSQRYLLNNRKLTLQGAQATLYLER